MEYGNALTMASLFDGIGGFLLAAVRNGITPVWASEIEPLRGEPLPGLSVAGARAGLAGTRSGLFSHQIRIIKEMRDADKRLGRTGVDVRPRFAVWENVPGCLSSTSDGIPGSDFQEVIEAFARIEEPYLDVIRPASGRWEYTGAVLGVRSCVAWTEWAAEYFGVPQRRRRIFAVTDFAGFRPIQILFEQDSLLGYHLVIILWDTLGNGMFYLLPLRIAGFLSSCCHMDLRYEIYS